MVDYGFIEDTWQYQSIVLKKTEEMLNISCFSMQIMIFFVDVDYFINLSSIGQEQPLSTLSNAAFLMARYFLPLLPMA